MAGQRLTDKGTYGTTAIDWADLIMGVDISDSTGSADGTSKSLKAQRLITTVTSSLDNAAVQDLDSTPLDLFNPGTGFIVIPIAVTIVTAYAASTESSNNNLYIGYDSSQTAVYWDLGSRFMGTIGTSNAFVFSGGTPQAKGVNTATIESLPLKMWSNGAFNGGWTCDVYATVSVFPAI
jgi:hypothetical protein